MKIEELMQNNELNKIVALKVGKMPYEPITEGDFAKVEEINLNARLINGKESGISLEAVSLFPNLRKLRLSNYRINKEAIETMASLAGLKDLEIFGAEFEEGIDFTSLAHSLKSLKFYNCLEVSFPYPSLEEVWLSNTDIDFCSVDLQSARRIIIRNANVRNACDLTDFPNIESINFDGSNLIGEDGEKLSDIKVSEKTQYTHKDENLLLNGEREY